MEIGAWGAEFEARLYDDLTAGFGLEGRHGFHAAGSPLAAAVLGDDEKGGGGREAAVVRPGGVGLLLVVGGGTGVAGPLAFV